MLKVALTGGIATGKSRVRTSLSARGVPTIDSDRLAHEAMAGGSPVWQEIVDCFGRAVVRPDGEIDRRRLGAIVFGEPEARRALEAIVHPAVYGAIERWFRELEAEKATIAVADIPLLYETGHAASVDRVVVVACEPGEQLRRVMARDGLSVAEARQRIAAQLPMADKAAQADFVLRTDGTSDETERQVGALLEQLQAEAAVGRT